jgi:hypothetical protein
VVKKNGSKNDSKMKTQRGNLFYPQFEIAPCVGDANARTGFFKNTEHAEHTEIKRPEIT